VRGESRAAWRWCGLQNGWANEMKHAGNREKGNTRFPDPPYIHWLNRLTDEYMSYHQ
jgi:hypothetical protein